jgi:DNA-binding GntR family transcriptional regulator
MSGIQLRQARRQLLRTEVAEIIRDGILSGRFIGDQKLNEKVLAEEMGISRGSLREAFRVLEQEGIVYSLQNHGTFVVKLSQQGAVDLKVFRDLVEPFVVQQALKVSSSLPKSIQQSLSQMYDCAAADDRLGVVKAHIQLHGHFYAATGNKYLKLLWDSMKAPLYRFFMLMAEYRPLIDIPNAHKRLVDLVANGDAIGLDLELRNHLIVTWDQDMAFLQERIEVPSPLPSRLSAPYTVNYRRIRNPDVAE